MTKSQGAERRAPREVRILLADPEWLFREAVSRVLEEEPAFRVVAKVDGVAEARIHAQRTRPTVGIVSSELADGYGVATIRTILEETPGCRVALLTDSESPTLLREAVEAGASGCITRDADVADLVEATWALSRDEIVIASHLLRELLEDLVRRRRKGSEHRRLLAQLTPREREVLAKLARGATSQAIADALGISRETARTHAHNLLRKLGMHSRLEAASFVLQNGLLDELLQPEEW